ncbi:MAG: Carbohydrate binding domain, partial [Haloplasmataceae bacterium]|nr:Carbohydrate binding domain [Haloplasmataceae bacterium]
AGVTAEDNVDGDITDDIIVSGNWDASSVGEYTITYTVEDSAGNEKVKSRTLKVKAVSFAGSLKNPHFDTDSTGWNLWAGNGGVATSTVENGEVKIEITSVGDQNWHVQFEQKELTLEAGKMYKVTFKARAVAPRSVGVLLEDPNNGNYKYGTTSVNLTTSMETYVLNIKMGATTINTGKFAFMLGKVDVNSIATTVYLDDIVMQETTEIVDTTKPVITGESNVTIDLNSQWNQLSGMTVTDDLDTTLTVEDIVVTGIVSTDVIGIYTITYEVTDNANNKATFTRIVTVEDINYVDTNELVNGDFSTSETITANHENETGWREYHYTEGQSVQFNINNSALDVNIADLGWTSGGWSIQVQQAGINLEKDKTYKLVFDAVSSVARDVDVTFKTTSEATYASTTLRIGTTFETQEFTFTFSGDTNDNMILSLGLGRFNNSTASLMTFDNFKLFVVE